MSDWTPTTEVIRHALAFPRERLGEPRPIKPEAFDRWLEQVKSEAWEEGKRAGLRQSDTANQPVQGARSMSENTTWRDIVQAVSRLESNRDSKDGRKDERERAKTLRDPDRLAEIQLLQEALRRKNEKYRRLRAQYKRLKDSKRPRTRAYIERIGGDGLPWDEYVWEATIMRGPRWHDSDTFSTYADALAWALEQLKEEQ